MNRYLRKVLSEMCRRAGTTFKDQNFTAKDWYTKHSWTEKRQNAFRAWLKRYLMTNARARRAVMAFPIRSARHIDKFVCWWTLDYCWKVKQ